MGEEGEGDSVRITDDFEFEEDADDMMVYVLFNTDLVPEVIFHSEADAANAVQWLNSLEDELWTYLGMQLR